MKHRRAFGVLATLGVAACWLGAPLDDPKDASAPDAGDASVVDVDASDQTDGGQKKPCGALHGADMIIVTSQNPLEPKYCIDSTEVTEAQYQEFLDAKIPTTTQPAVCSNNKTFYPDLVQNFCQFDPKNRANFPVACVDWCDALAFCAWAGKRLCGGMGRDGGPVGTFNDINTATTDEWFNACSREGAHKYPYGDTFDASTCNGAQRPDGGSTLPVKSLPACTGGFPGMFDMSGNVAEWENACFDGGPDAGVICDTRGGSLTELESQLTCDQGDLQPPETTGYNRGIRCCADFQ